MSDRHHVSVPSECSGGPVLEEVHVTGDEPPRYKLRAISDCNSDSGTDSAFVQYPALLDTHLPSPLHHDLIEAALSYFVLSGERVSQMSRVYSDLEAVTSLLQEKERDLELAAKIGKQLLERNKQIDERLSEQQTELQCANETITQLRHELQLKCRLLQLYTSETEPDLSPEVESACGRIGADSAGACGASGAAWRQADVLQSRISRLEAENRELRCDFTRITESTEQLESREQQLVDDVTWQLTDANATIRSLSDELALRAEESIKSQEETTNLLAQLVELQSRCSALSRDNDELLSCRAAGRQSQCQLTSELAELRQSYCLLQAMYRDSQHHISRIERNSASLWAGCVARQCHVTVSGDVTGGDHSQPESLASELELARQSLGSTADSGALWPAASPLAATTTAALPGNREAPSAVSRHNAEHVMSVFDTVRYAKRASISSQQTHFPALSPPPPSSSSSSLLLHTVSASTQATAAAAAAAGVPLSHPSSLSHYYHYGTTVAPPPPDVIPSAALFQHSNSHSHSHGDYRHWSVGGVATGSGAPLSSCGGGGGGGGDGGQPDFSTTTSVITDSDYSIDFNGDSDMLTGATDYAAMLAHRGAIGDDISNNSSYAPAVSDRSATWRLSEKLQIVKPVSGSAALSHWCRLATPNLGSLLERPSSGVLNSRRLSRPRHHQWRARQSPGAALDSCGASETDSDYDSSAAAASPATPLCVGGVLRAPADTTGVYTLTNSTVLHPDQHLSPPLLPSPSFDSSAKHSQLQTQLSWSPPSTTLSTTLSTTVTSAAICRDTVASPSAPALCLSRCRSVTSTFSTSVALARALHERTAPLAPPPASVCSDRLTTVSQWQSLSACSETSGTGATADSLPHNAARQWQSSGAAGGASGGAASVKCTTPANSPCHSRPGSPSCGESASGAETGSGGKSDESVKSQSLVQGLLRAGYGLPLGMGDLLRRALFSVTDCEAVSRSASQHHTTPPVSADHQQQQRHQQQQQQQRPCRPPLTLNRSVRRQMSLLERLERLGLQEAVAVIGQRPPARASLSPATAAISSASARRRSSGGTSLTASGGLVSRRRTAATLAMAGQLPPTFGSVPPKQQPAAAARASGGHSERAAGGGMGDAARLQCVGSVGILCAGRKGGYM